MPPKISRIIKKTSYRRASLFVISNTTDTEKYRRGTNSFTQLNRTTPHRYEQFHTWEPNGSTQEPNVSTQEPNGKRLQPPHMNEQIRCSYRYFTFYAPWSVAPCRVTQFSVRHPTLTWVVVCLHRGRVWCPLLLYIHTQKKIYLALVKLLPLPIKITQQKRF